MGKEAATALATGYSFFDLMPASTVSRIRLPSVGQMRKGAAPSRKPRRKVMVWFRK
jgi:hypothetical protein